MRADDDENEDGRAIIGDVAVVVLPASWLAAAPRRSTEKEEGNQSTCDDSGRGMEQIWHGTA